MKKKNKPFFKQLFEYNHFSNRQMIDVLEQKETENQSKAIQRFNHIINVHQVWNNRIIPLHEPLAPWVEQPHSEWGMIDFENFTLSKSIIEKLELNSRISYRNSKGDSFENTIGDILFHIINHSTYHRGQIALLLRQNDMEPIATDYILYKRYQPVDYDR